MNYVTLRAAGYLMIAPGSGEAEAVGLSVDGENLEPGMAQPRRRVNPTQCCSPARAHPHKPPLLLVVTRLGDHIDPF
jgi:hypothetical protein